MRIIKILMAIFLTFGVGFGIDWMDLMPDARALGMGEISIAQPFNNFSGYTNPAIGAKKSKASFTNYKLFESVNYSHINIACLNNFGAFCLGYDEIIDPGYQKTDYINSKPQIVGDPFSNGTKEMYINAAIVKQYSGLPFDFGITGKYLQQQIDQTKADGFSMDAGLLYQPIPELYVGVVQYNLAQTNLKWNNSSEAQILPQKTKIGISFVSSFLIIGLEYYLAGYREQRISYGAEYILFNFIALRAGMNRANFTAGLGINLLNLSFDLAYTPPVDDILSENWRFSCSLTL